MYKLTKTQLLNLSLHLGHKSSTWTKSYSLYTYAIRNGVVIFNLDYIQLLFNRAFQFVEKVLEFKGRFFSVSNFVNVGFGGLGEYFFSPIGFGFYDGRFIGGLVSNFFIIRNVTRRFKYEFRSSFWNFKMYLPSGFLIFDTNEFFGCIRESLYVGVPSISIVDSDLDYRDAFYPIIGNNENIFFGLYVLIFVKNMYRKMQYLRFLKYYKVVISVIFLFLRYKLLKNFLRLGKLRKVLRYFYKRRNPHVMRAFRYKVLVRKGVFYTRKVLHSVLVVAIRLRLLLLRVFLDRLSYPKYRYRIFWFLFFTRYYNPFKKRMIFTTRDYYQDVEDFYDRFKFLRLFFKPYYIMSYEFFFKTFMLYFAKRAFLSKIRKAYRLSTIDLVRERLYTSHYFFRFISRKYFDRAFFTRVIRHPKFIFFDFKAEPYLLHEFKRNYDKYKYNRQELLAYKERLMQMRYILNRDEKPSLASSKVVKYFMKETDDSIRDSRFHNKALPNDISFRYNSHRVVKYASFYFISYVYLRRYYTLIRYNYYKILFNDYRPLPLFYTNMLGTFKKLMDGAKIFYNYLLNTGSLQTYDSEVGVHYKSFFTIFNKLMVYLLMRRPWRYYSYNNDFNFDIVEVPKWREFLKMSKFGLTDPDSYFLILCMKNRPRLFNYLMTNRAVLDDLGIKVKPIHEKFYRRFINDIYRKEAIHKWMAKRLSVRGGSLTRNFGSLGFKRNT